MVTGAAGFIGSNIVKGLNARGIDDIIVVDDLTQGDKFRNLADLKIADYVDADVFYDLFAEGAFGKVEAVFHEGACSDTMETDGKYMMDNNYTLSCGLFNACQERGSRLLYASSAATYGGSDTFRETPEFERPLNVYGYSKLLFDQRMRRELGDDLGRAKTGRRQVVGFRYFNVYGPREQHKGRMASVAFHQFNQFQSEGKVKLFGQYGGYGPGEQKRDFVFIDDVVAVNLWFLDHPGKSGIFNLGSGRAQPFNDVATAVVNALRADAGQPAFDTADGRCQGTDRVHPLPRRPARQVPVLHPGRPGGLARCRLRPRLCRRADGRRQIHGPVCYPGAASTRLRRWRASAGQQPRVNHPMAVALVRGPWRPSAPVHQPLSGEIHAEETIGHCAHAVRHHGHGRCGREQGNRGRARQYQGHRPVYLQNDHLGAQERRIQELGRLHRARQGRG